MSLRHLIGHTMDHIMKPAKWIMVGRWKMEATKTMPKRNLEGISNTATSVHGTTTVDTRSALGDGKLPETEPHPEPNYHRSSSVSSNWSASSSGSTSYTNLRSRLTREQRNRNPFDFYEIVKTLGQGSMGSVRLVRKRPNKIGGSARQVDRLPESSEKATNDQSVTTKQTQNEDDSESNNEQQLLDSPTRRLTTTGGSKDYTYAMKSIVLSHINNKVFIEELRNEINILRELDHPNIVRAIETFEFQQEICIVMEVCTGGDLYCRDPYSEAEAARIVHSIASAISFMHSKQLAHLDLKYENILFAHPGPDAEVKLIDFGLSKKFGKDYLTEGVGTIYTMAPEVMRGKYSAPADMWSVGVLAYILLSSMFPFYGRRKKEIARLVLRGQFHFCGPRWEHISEEARDFIRGLLVLDPEQRMDAAAALSSVWLKTGEGSQSAVKEEKAISVRSSMARYANYSRLKKIALMIVAHKSSSEEIGDLKQIFKKFDSRNDGSISYEEFCDAMKEYDSETGLQMVFDSMDLDGTGRIQYTEFIAATIEARGLISEERLAEAFDRLDGDDSGFISSENIAEILGPDVSRGEVDDIISEVNVTNSRRLSYADFLGHWEEKIVEQRNKGYSLLGDKLFLGVDRSTAKSDPESTTSIDKAKGSAAIARAEFLQQKFGSARPFTVHW